MIQGSINQLLSIAAVYSKFAPGAEARAEAYQGEKKVKAALKRSEAIQKATGNLEGGPAGSIENELFNEALKEYQAGVEQQFRAQPGSRGFSDVKSIRTELRNKEKRAQAQAEADAALNGRQEEISPLLRGTKEGVKLQQANYIKKAKEDKAKEMATMLEENPELGTPGGM